MTALVAASEPSGTKPKVAREGWRQPRDRPLQTSMLVETAKHNQQQHPVAQFIGLRKYSRSAQQILFDSLYGGVMMPQPAGRASCLKCDSRGRSHTFGSSVLGPVTVVAGEPARGSPDKSGPPAANLEHSANATLQAFGRIAACQLVNRVALRAPAGAAGEPDHGARPARCWQHKE
jgi:hypothetical protein